MPGLICAFDPCRRHITGADVARRVEVRQVDGAPVAFGQGMPAGTLERAEGPLAEVYHSKCWYSHLKRTRLLAARSADPTGNPGAADWRDQETCDAEAFR